jgi:hypothetical protein
MLTKGVIMPDTTHEVIEAVMSVITDKTMTASEKEFEIARLMGILDAIDKFGEAA